MGLEQPIGFEEAGARYTIDVYPTNQASRPAGKVAGVKNNTWHHVGAGHLLHIISFLTLPDLLSLDPTCRCLPSALLSPANAKGPYLQSLGRGWQRALMASILSPPSHGYHKLALAQQHLFLLGYSRTHLLLRDSGRHACSCQALSHGVRDVCRPLTPPSPPATAMLGGRPLLPTVTVDPRGEPPHACMLTEQKQSDTLEVFDPADVQHIFCISFPSSIHVRQAVVTSTETPMYFFLLNLSLLDLGSISTTLPKAMANSLWDTRDISYGGCAAQLLFFVFFLAAEFCLLTIMAYDRYVAICKPLHYGSLLGSRACVHMAAAAWGSGFLYALLHTANTFSLPLCQGNALDQFFCEIPQILKLSCSHSYLREVGLLVVSACLTFGCFVFIVLSYVQIFRAVLRIPSEQGRHKAFSTCLPHLAVVSLFVSTAAFAYLKPPSISSPVLDLVVAVLYSLLPPAVNPLIYSMRNRELKEAIRYLISWI
ncbi:olfactory receptor 14C36-like, partial [Chroicocephalus ridibundus]|uniref:olfactory receptor 14C36-like n=1 Tax=Chroicocephalus ridibundus TaxID=1192867 RepID=UPI002FDEE0EE